MLTDLLYKAGRIVIGSYARLMLKMDVHWHETLPNGPQSTTPAPPTQFSSISFQISR